MRFSPKFITRSRVRLVSVLQRSMCPTAHKQLALRRRLCPGPMGQAHHVRRAAPSEGYYWQEAEYWVCALMGVGPGLCRLPRTRYMRCAQNTFPCRWVNRFASDAPRAEDKCVIQHTVP